MSNLLILIPLFNDWTAVRRLLAELDVVLGAAGRRAGVLLVDDGSTDPAIGDRELVPAELNALDRIVILRLRRNLGAQRAIAVGLAWVDSHVACDCVVVMDGDGEDRPQDVPRLLAEFERTGEKDVVFAERTKRSEGAWYTLMYALYRALHLMLTGERVRVGNFSVVPMPLLKRLVAVSDIWNHYAAGVFKSRIPYRTVPTSRGTRYSGRSHMNQVSLIAHGLSAMSVFGDRIGVRMLLATTGIAAVTVAALVTALMVRLLSGAGFPSWTPYGLVLAALVLFQAVTASLTFVFIILSARDTSSFIPLRDYVYFIAGVHEVLHAQPHELSVPR